MTETPPAAPVPVHCPGCRRVLGHAEPGGLRVGPVLLPLPPVTLLCVACGARRFWGRQKLPGKLHPCVDPTPGSGA